MENTNVNVKPQKPFTKTTLPTLLWQINTPNQHYQKAYEKQNLKADEDIYPTQKTAPKCEISNGNVKNKPKNQKSNQ